MKNIHFPCAGKTIALMSFSKAHKTLLLFSLALLPFMVPAQNLVDMNDWVSGTSGATTNYNLQGTASQNSRITMAGPYGNSVTVWQALADGASGMNGGLSHKGVTMDTNKSYRISFWVRSNGANNCTNYTGFTPYYTTGGLIQPFSNENGGTTSWPYISSRAMPDDKWFLVVGYLRPSSASDNGESGIYDPSLATSSTLPAPSYTTLDFIFPSGVSQIYTRIRSFMWACGAGEKMFVYDPRVEEINGNETPLLEILTGNSGNIAVTGVSLSPTSLSLDINQNGTITPTVSPNDATDISLTWSSNNTGVATVNSSGTVTGVSEGTATITATSVSNNTISAQATVEVTGTTQPPTTGGHWTKENDARLHYTAGKVGIGTNAPDDMLTVKGQIHAQKVKVDLNGAIAPDYVFLKDYNLKTLEEVQEHIDTFGHLPNIPSAKEMEQNGIELKTMNLKLLEKIEELTLYLLQQQTEIEELKNLLKKER